MPPLACHIDILMIFCCRISEILNCPRLRCKALSHTRRRGSRPTRRYHRMSSHRHRLRSRQRPKIQQEAGKGNYKSFLALNQAVAHNLYLQGTKIWRRPLGRKVVSPLVLKWNPWMNQMMAGNIISSREGRAHTMKTSTLQDLMRASWPKNRKELARN